MLSSYLATLRTFQRNVWLYFAAMSLIGFTVDGGIYSVVFNLFLLRLGYGPEFVGQINSMGLLAFAICSLPAGALGVRIGNRRAMIVGLSIMMLSSFALALSEFVPVSLRVYWLFGFYIGFHSSIAIFFVNTAPFLMAVTHETQRSHAFALQSAMISLAAFAGSLIGGVMPGLFAHRAGLTLEAAAPYRYPLLIAAVMLIVGVVALFGMKDVDGITSSAALAPLPPRRTYPSLFRVPRFPTVSLPQIERGFLVLVVVISLVRIFQIAGMATLATFFNVYMDDGLGAPTAQVGLLTGLGRLLAVPIVLTMPILSARWGHRHLVTISSLSAALFLLPLAFIPQWWAAGLGYMGIMAGSSIRYTSFMIFIMAMIKPEQRSFMSGLSEMTAGLSFAVMALLGGYIIVNQGYQTLFLIGAAATLFGTLLFWAYFRNTQPARQIVEATVTGD
jgi:MFS family permease